MIILKDSLISLEIKIYLVLQYAFLPEFKDHKRRAAVDYFDQEPGANKAVVLKLR